MCFSWNGIVICVLLRLRRVTCARDVQQHAMLQAAAVVVVAAAAATMGLPPPRRPRAPPRRRQVPAPVRVPRE